MSEYIEIKGARVHNLKNVSVKIPRNKITVITGISGSGKSSLAFDTIFAEGQRRYVESLSSYARQFLGVIEKPDVDEINGLSPALAIDQRSSVRSPRSTVGTMSEIYDLLRLIWSSIGYVYCLKCGTRMEKISFETAKAQASALDHFKCPNCGANAPEITISTFSFNSPMGACPQCQGLGKKLRIDPEAVVPNSGLTLAEGAIRPWTRIGAGSNWYQKILNDLSQKYSFSLDKPFGDLPAYVQTLILHGAQDEANGGFEGVVRNLERRYGESDSEYIRQEIEKYMIKEICPLCQGKRLRQESLNVKVAGKNIIEASALAIEQFTNFIDELGSPKGPLGQVQQKIAKNILQECRRRLDFLIDVGLSYLTLDRAADTLAGGEAQRIRLATQLGSKLMGVIYILDEPSIGLHPRDQSKLLKTLTALKDLGNTVIVVEHDQATMEIADHIIDVGPGAGDNGGQIIAQGTLEQIKKSPSSVTGRYISGRQKIEIGRKSRSGGSPITITGAGEFNLKNINVAIPTEMFVCVTGVSGSGKSTLVTDILANKLKQHFYRTKTQPGKYKSITGIDLINKIIEVDQSPIGRTPRSNPATYTGVFGPLRDLFANVEDAKKRRFSPAQFSFNLKGGRCEHCRGDGVLKVEMHFLPTVYVRCEVCGGKRYNEETLQIRYKDKTISDVLDMTIDEAKTFFRDIPDVLGKLEVLYQVGLGYLKLGQPATTLSGGEAQRIKLATELARPQTSKTLYIFDEPTTGLHFEDIRRLLHVLHSLVDKGNTVLVVEHNLDVIKNSDWVIDLGPDGGQAGGYLVGEGTPEQIAQIPKSYTGQFLKKVL